MNRPTRWPKVILLGATGVVGTELARQISERGGVEDLVLVSRRGRGGAIAIDVNDRSQLRTVTRSVDVVVNLVASTRWTMNRDEARSANCETLAAVIEGVGSNCRLIHLSTAYADGVRGGTDFRNNYEWSKAEAEALLRERRPDASLIRFPLVIGRRSDGGISRYVGLYTLLQGMTSGLLPAIIGSPETRVEIAPVDVVADRICEVILGTVDATMENDQPGFSIGAGANAPRVDELFGCLADGLNSWRSVRGLSSIHVPPLIRPEAWQRFHRPFVWPHLHRTQRRAIELLEEFAPYLDTPLEMRPDFECDDLLQTLTLSVESWANEKHRVASRTPREWAAGEDGGVWRASD